MRAQSNGWDCAPTAIANALRALGRHVTQADVLPHSGTTEREGTTQFGVRQACERLGHGHDELTAPFARAYEELRAHLLAGGAAVLSVEGGEHWTAAVGVCGERTLIFDGQAWARRGDESGLLVLSRDQLRRHWSSGRQRYAVLVRPRA